MNRACVLVFGLLLLVCCSAEITQSARGALTTGPAEPEMHLSMAPVRGYLLMNQILTDRWTDGTGAVDLRAFLDGVPVNGIPPGKGSSLSDLLGVANEDGVHTGMKNAQPNTAGMLVWYLALDGFSATVSQVCSGSPESAPGSALRSDVHELVSKLCAWPLLAPAGDEALRLLWELGMQNDAPESEFAAWQAFVHGADFSATGQQAVHAMILAMLDNPFLLIKP